MKVVNKDLLIKIIWSLCVCMGNDSEPNPIIPVLFEQINTQMVPHSFTKQELAHLYQIIIFVKNLINQEIWVIRSMFEF